MICPSERCDSCDLTKVSIGHYRLIYHNFILFQTEWEAINAMEVDAPVEFEDSLQPGKDKTILKNKPESLVVKVGF